MPHTQTLDGIGIKRVHPVQHGGGVGQFARAIVEAALAAAHAAEIEAHRGAAQPVEHVEQVIDQRIVHGAAELGMGVQHQRHGRAGVLLPLVARLDAARRAGKNDVRHGSSFPPRICKRITRFLPGRRPSKTNEISVTYRMTDQADREYLTNLLRNSISPAIRRACRPAPLYTGRGVKKQGKTPLYRREPAMRLSTKGRYAVMAMADLAGNASDPADPGDSGRWPWPISPRARTFRSPIWNSFSPSCGAAGWSPACAAPAAAIACRGLPASCASPTSSWRWTSPSPPPAARPAAQGLHQDRRALRHP